MVVLLCRESSLSALLSYWLLEQAYAAQELYTRDWRFHSVLKLWFKKVTAADGNVPPGVQYIYFDHNEWERRYFAGNVQMNVSGNILAGCVSVFPCFDDGHSWNIALPLSVGLVSLSSSPLGCFEKETYVVYLKHMTSS